MAQPAFPVDELQIEPGATGSRSIKRDTTDGGLQFVDPNVTIALKDLVGLRSVTGVYIVGRAGDGAPYTSIQAALDDIPDSSSAAAPSLVWILPGVYTENLQVRKDGVILASPGGAKISNSGDESTVVIRPSVDATPLYTVLLNLVITNDQAGRACVYVDGSDEFASGTLTVATAPLAVGDTFTIGGVEFTGVASTRTSGNDDFSVSGGTTAAVAAEIAAAINDPDNSLYQVVTASVLGSTVTVTAYDAGADGNAITLASTTVPGGGITLSGANLSGGGSAGAATASQGIYILDCDINALEYQVQASYCNNLYVRGGTWQDSSGASSFLASQCALLRIWNVEWTNHFNVSYDNTEDEPSAGTSVYLIGSCGKVGNVTSNLVGVGSLTLSNLPDMGTLTVGGDRTVAATECTLGNVSIDDTIAVTLSRCKRGTVTVAGGTPTLAESLLIGSAAFANASSAAVTFGFDQPNTSYFVLLDNPQVVETVGVSGKAVGGFTINSSGNITGTVGYAVMRNL